MDNPEKTNGANHEWTIQRKPKGQSRMDNPEKTNGANQEWTIQRKPKGQSRMDNPEILASLVKQDIGRRRTKHNT
jgi:hypothetical protein